MDKQQINHFIKEDAPQGDITSKAIFSRAKKRAHAAFLAKEDLVVCGISSIKNILRQKFSHIKFQVLKQDGSAIKKGTVIGRLTGPITEILMAERLCLNLLQRLSGIATLTAAFVKLAKKNPIQIMDTRKTTPGLRYEEKQAVKDGGGVNHRMNLSDHYLIKNNHIDGAGSVTEAINLVKRHQKRGAQKKKIEVEVRNKGEFQEALALRPDIILLDNMNPASIRKMVQLRNKIQKGKKKRS